MECGLGIKSGENHELVLNRTRPVLIALVISDRINLRCTSGKRMCLYRVGGPKVCNIKGLVSVGSLKSA